MRWILPLLIVISCSFSALGSKRGDQSRATMRVFNRLRAALRASQSGDYVDSTRKLFILMYHPALKKQRNKIRYHLALNLYNMGLYHPAVFQFQTLVKSRAKGYVGKSLRKIILIAINAQDKQLLNHTISRVNLSYVPSVDRQKLRYHFGKFWMQKGKFQRAITHFSRVKSSNPFFHHALYQIGLAHTESGRLSRAASIFDNLQHRVSGVTDDMRVAAIMGKARVNYQAKKWKLASDQYLMIPKDSVFWHDTLLERSWALLQGGHLRAALGNFHTLHSSYYNDHYQPESLLLRAIVYLYICKHHEMKKVLTLFGKIYRSVHAKVKELINSSYSLKSHYQSLLFAMGIKPQRERSHYIKYPTLVARRIFR